jgi:hypothetical protein
VRHAWYECGRRCEGFCIWCGGGLSACTVCWGLEGSLPSHCPGAEMDDHTATKVYHQALDFINGAWVRPVDLVARLRGNSAAWCREELDRIAALPSMQRHQAIRGW